MHRASRVSCLVPAVFAPFWVYGQASCETGSEAVARKGTLIVKFGGSAITEKAVFESLKRDVLLSSARGVQRAFDSGIWDRIVVVHGAGSFGHFQAKQHALKNGRSSQSDDSTPSLTSWRTGLSLTRQSVQKLNLEVLAAHVATGLPAVAVSPFPTAITGHVANSVQPHINPNRSAVKQPGVLNHLLDLADSGLVPIIHGDIVLDDSQTCAVLGGDHIISWLCRKLSTDSAGSEPIRVVFLTDVAGVYTQAPHVPGAKLVTHIGVHADGTTDLQASTETAVHDVTGGIAAKLQAAADMARLGSHVEVYIVQAGTRSAEQALCGGVPESGTLLQLSTSIATNR